MATQITLNTFLKNQIHEYKEDLGDSRPHSTSLLWNSIISTAFGLQKLPFFVQPQNIFQGILPMDRTEKHIVIGYCDIAYIVSYEDLVEFWLKSNNKFYKELTDKSYSKENIVAESMIEIVVNDPEKIIISYIHSLKKPYVDLDIRQGLS